MTLYDLLAIDPGAKLCACAGFDDSRLVWSFDASPFVYSGVRAPSVVWEIPQADGRSTPADDLIALTHAGATLAAWSWYGPPGEITAVQPRTWKGSVPKPVHHSRMWAALDAAERVDLGGLRTKAAIESACQRGGADRWKKPGAKYYRASEYATVRGERITHDRLDAAALGLYALGRLTKGSK